MFGDQPRALGGRLPVVNKLFFGAADQNHAFLHGFGRLSLGAEPGRDHVTIEHVIGQVLLEIVFGIILQHDAHIGHRHRWQFRVAHQRVAHTDSQDRLFGAGGQRLCERSQVFPQQLWRQPFLVGRRVLECVT